MRSRRLLALAVLAALPFTVTGAGAAPATPNTGSAVSKVDTRGLVIDVRKGGHGLGGRGFGGGRAFKGGGFGGGTHALGGGGRRMAGSRGGSTFALGGGGRVAGYGGRGPGRHWHGGGGHHHHGHRHFRPRFYGVPYYGYGYGSYYPNYYYDDAYYDDDADDDYGDGAVYANDGDAVARCEARYRSFDRSSGTFLANDGQRKLCPYLR